MAVGVRPRVLAVKRECDTGLFLNSGIDAFEARANVLERQRLPQRKIQIFRKPIITKIAALQCGSSLESQDRPQVRLREGAQKPGEAIISFENVFPNAHPAASREAVGKQRNVSLRNQSSAPGRLQFLRRDVDLQPPLGDVRPFPRKQRIERNVGRCQGFPKNSQLLFGRKAEQIEQIAQTALYGTNVQARGVFKEFLDIHIGAAHPEALSDLSYASTVFGLAESIDDGAFEIADFDCFLFRHPVFHRAKEMQGLQENKAELSSMQCLFRYAFGTGNEYDKLRLRHHAMEFHGGGMREIVGSGAGQIACDQVRISRILDRGSKLGGNDDKQPAFQPRYEASLGGLMEQTAGKWGLQSGDSDGVSIGKRRLPRFVESHQKLGHLTAYSSQVRVIVCAQWIACEAKNDALSISVVILYVK